MIVNRRTRAGSFGNTDGTFSPACIERAIAQHGPRLATIVWPGVQYRTGQAFDLQEIARFGHAKMNATIIRYRRAKNGSAAATNSSSEEDSSDEEEEEHSFVKVSW